LIDIKDEHEVLGFEIAADGEKCPTRPRITVDG
jgi:hypothetical protein